MQSNTFSPPPFYALKSTIGNRNSKMLKALLTRYGGANFANPSGETLMHFAAEIGDVNAISILFDANANINAKDHRGNTPLHFAIKSQIREAIDFLIAEKADVNAATKNGTTPLHKAALIGDLTTVKTLIAAGANLDAQNNHQATALHLAANTGRSSVAQALAEAGADPNLQNREKLTALHLAARRGDLITIKALIAEGAEIDHRANRQKMTPLHLAMEAGKEETINVLLTAGANSKLRNISRENALDIAVKKQHTSIVNLLKAHMRSQTANIGQADFLNESPLTLNQLDNEGYTPLHRAVFMEDQTKLLALLQAGADITVKDKWGRQAIHIAAYKGNHRIIRVLLSHHAEKNCIEPDLNLTPLHVAVFSGQIEVVKMLVDSQADLNAQTLEGKTPLDLAKEQLEAQSEKAMKEKYSQIADILTQTNKQTLDAFAASNELADKHTHPESLLSLSSKNSSTKTRVQIQSESSGESRLHRAALKGDIREMRVLIMQKVDINARDRYGETPLHIASRAGQESAVELLLQYKANVIAANKEGQIALELAKTAGHTKAIRLLSEATYGSASAHSLSPHSVSLPFQGNHHAIDNNETTSQSSRSPS